MPHQRKPSRPKPGPKLTNFLKSIWFIKILLTFGLAGALLIGLVFMKDPASERFSDYKIELLSINAYENKDNMLVTEGTLQNVSPDPLENIKAVISWYDKRDNFILACEQLVDQGLLKHYETSTFKVAVKKEPGLDKYKVAFRSGRQLISLVYSRPFKSLFPDEKQ